MHQEKKYNLSQVLADIDEDISAQENDMTQHVNISQPVIAALMRKKTARTGSGRNKETRDD